MKIHIPVHSDQTIGGGFSFIRNIEGALKGKVDFVDDIEDCDIFLIAGVTLVERYAFSKAKELGKKIITRVDGIPRNTRTQNTGTSRLFDYCQGADEVIYQSQWARNFIKPFVKKDGTVILNGVDTNIFNPEGRKIEKNGSPQYLYVRINRDETKGWVKVWYDFQRVYFKNPKAHLWIVGRFADKNLGCNFDFFGGAEKRYGYYSIVDKPSWMAQLYRGADVLLCPYSNDACSNVLIEGLVSGTKVLYDKSGGSVEVVKKFKERGRDYFSLERMGSEYLEVFKKVEENNK